MGSGGSCPRRSLREGVLEKEAGCKGRHCCVCEKNCPSGDEEVVAAWRKGAGVSGVLVRAKLVNGTCKNDGNLIGPVLLPWRARQNFLHWHVYVLCGEVGHWVG